MSEIPNTQKPTLTPGNQEGQDLANTIPCPALLSLYNTGKLKTDANGNVSTAHLEEVLADLGLSSIVRNMLVRGADKTDNVPNSFNLFELRQSNLNHHASTGVRDPKVNPEKLQDALLQFSRDGRMYAQDFAKAANHAYSQDPGLGGTMTQSLEFTALLEVFGRVDEKGNRYLTVDDVKGLWLDGKFPEDWKPRAANEVGVIDILGGTAELAVQRFLSILPKFFR